MIQLVYSIFENNEPIFIQNFPYKDMETAKNDLKDTYKDILKDKNVTNIKFTDMKLKFTNCGVEKHQMSIIENK